MGIVHVHRGRLTLALAVVALTVLAAAVAFAVLAAPASAQKTFTTCMSTGCHAQASGDAFHQKAPHQSAGCATCHTGGFGAGGVTPKSCVSCHGGTESILNANDTHTGPPQSCATTPGCHGVPPAVVTTTMTLKVAPASVKVKQPVKITGTAGPLPVLAGAKVAVKIELKVGKKWTKAKAATAKVGAKGAFTLTYKPAKKGSYQVTATIAKTSSFTAKTLKKAFKAKQ
jgi:hypothetical protein